MRDPAPDKQTLDAREITEEEADAEPAPEPQAKPAPPPPGDIAEKKGPESKFHG
jgi:hypothetical protein